MYKGKGRKTKISFIHQDILLRARFFSENFKCCIVTLSASQKLSCFTAFLYTAAPLATGCQDAWFQTQWQSLRGRTGL